MSRAQAETITSDSAGPEVQKCRACGDPCYLPRTLCWSCGSDRIENIPAGGDGVVHAATTIHRAPGPEFAAAGPYGILLVDLDEGVRVMARTSPSERGCVVTWKQWWRTSYRSSRRSNNQSLVQPPLPSPPAPDPTGCARPPLPLAHCRIERVLRR